MAVLGAALQSKSWYYDKQLMANFVGNAEQEVQAGRATVVDGHLLRALVNGEAREEAEVLFKSHSKRRLSLGAVQAELARRSGSATAALAILSDICVASRNRGQGIITPLLLRRSVACTQALPRPSYDLLSSLKLLLPRTTAVAVTDEAAKVYEGAFLADVVKMAINTARGVVGIPYAVGFQVDNYVTDQGVNRHLLGAGAANFKQAQTETRMAGGCKTNTLDQNDGGYGEEYDHDRLMGIFGEENEAPGLLSSDDEDSIWTFKDNVVLVSSLIWFQIFKVDNLPEDTNGPFRLRDHILAPQVEACSASRADFKSHVLDWAKLIFGVIFPMVHIFFVFDTEYVPHYMSWIARGGLVAALMANTAVLPCKFHIRKHLAETLLARKKVLQFIITPLLLEVLVTSTKKWSQVRKEAEEDAGDADPEELDPEDGAAAEAFEAVAELAEEAQEEEFVEHERPRRERRAPDRLVEDDSDEEGEREEMEEEEEVDPSSSAAQQQKEGDKEFAAQERLRLTEESHVRKIKNIGPLRRLCRDFDISDSGARKELVERIITHLDLRPDYKALYAAEKFTCKQDLARKGLTVAYLRYICSVEGVPTEDEDGKNIPRPKLEADLTAKLDLKPKRPKKQKSFNEKVKMNLHRLNQLFFFLFFVWDGVKWGGRASGAW